MSKVQEKETGLLNNLSSSEIANELDSRLRELEKNISVAREFIKLADESYSELRHKWNLLQEEARNNSSTTSTKKESIGKDSIETPTIKTPQTKNRSKALDKSTRLAKSFDDASSLEPSQHKTKGTSKPEKEATIPSETKNPKDETITHKHRDGDRKHKNPINQSSKSHL
ncbi:MAG TPA: hypothetical protein VE955_12655 [Candidatus Dormibacteraeota bacterium]|nr:hypothetical protein [Candidatus Dormibacteraeota bacterium]